MRFSLRLWAALFLLTGSVSGQAEEAPFDGRDYLTPSISWEFFDSDRTVHNGPSLRLDLGHALTPSLAVELTMFGTFYSSSAGRLTQRGGMVNGLYYYGRHSRLSRFWLIGVGVMRSETETMAGSNMVGSAGWGTLYHLAGGAALRGALFYRIESDDGRSYDDFSLTLGVVLPLGKGNESGVE